MQTFLPYNVYYSVGLLDRQRLQKQLVECQQLVMVLTGKTTVYRNHPAAIMWEHNIGALIVYGRVCYDCYRYLCGGAHKSGEWLVNNDIADVADPVPPDWLYDGRVSHSHRANLARKGVAAFLAPSRSYEHRCANGRRNCITMYDTIAPSNIYCWPKFDGNKWIYRQKMVDGPWLPGEYKV